MATIDQYNKAIEESKTIFLGKTNDYGTSWRVLRPISVVDQIFIKAKRIRNIQETGIEKVVDDIPSEFKGILNYAIIGIVQMEIPAEKGTELNVEDVAKWYERTANNARELMLNKNHDYGEAWRDMSQESYTDLIISKLMRIKQILHNKGNTTISEGIDANFYDIINYAVFALIMIDEGKH